MTGPSIGLSNSITGGDPYKTTLQCWKYTVPAFLVPFMFVLDPSGQGLLLMGSTKALAAANWWSIAEVTLTAAIGVAALAGGFQGWALKRCDNAVVWLGQKEAKRLRHRRRRDGLDSGRVLEVRKTLDDLLTEVAAGSELLYDGLLASSLDGQPVQGRTVATGEILQQECVAIPRQSRMAAGDDRGPQLNVAVGMTTDERFIFVQVVPNPFVIDVD